MKTLNRSTKGFTLVEIMIVVVIIGLLAAMAIPAFQKVRQNSRRGALINDARQIGAAAQQYMMENSVTQVTVAYNSDNGKVTGQLEPYVKQLGTKYTYSTTIDADGTFSIGHPLVKGGFTGTGALGAAVVFNSEGQLYQP